MHLSPKTPAGEYASRHGECRLCYLTCQECSGPEREDCTSCPPTRFFSDGSCEISCHRGWYAMDRQCHRCHHTCSQCSDQGPDHCTGCDTDKFGVSRYLFQSQCRDACPEGYFHSQQHSCESCSSDCRVCLSASVCLHCGAGFRLRDGSCSALVCTSGEVANMEDQECVPCDEGCSRCERKDGDQVTRCLKCEADFYQLGSECHRYCPDRTFDDKKQMVCSPCEDKRCEVCDQSQCSWCEKGFYVSDGECVDHCPEGFYADVSNQECEPCHRSCRGCGGPGHDDCDSCEDTFTLKDGECLVGAGTDPCPEKHFRNGEGDCESCHSSCRTCSAAGKSDCILCPQGLFLTPRQQCTAQCPPGTFADQVWGHCGDCSEGCVTCQDGKKCRRCRAGLHLQDGQCVLQCDRGFSQAGVCRSCAPGCSSCQDSATRCLSCDKKHFLLEFTCGAKCPRGHFVREQECVKCRPNCQECNEEGLCGKCSDFFFLHEDQCVDQCPPGFFPTEQECVRCHVNCGSCDGPEGDDCLTCINPRAVRYNGDCLARCPPHTYYDGPSRECRECARTCLTCSGHEPSSCLTCDPDRRRDSSGHCVWLSDCALTSYLDQTGKCRSCHGSCHRCTGPGADHCLSCSAPRFLLNSTCVRQCPLSFYAEDKEERVCERCHSSCQSCSGRHSVQCLKCRSGFFRQGSACVEVCSKSHFGNISTMVCESCDPSCTRCQGRGNRKCLSCREGFIYFRQQGRCLKDCPQGYYHHRSHRTCDRCHPTCQTCSDEGALSCLSCYPGFEKIGDNICESRCFVGFYATAQKSESGDPDCHACDPSCLDCRGPGGRNCTQCRASRVLTDDACCLSCCGDELRLDKPVPRECCDCQASAVECVLGTNFGIMSREELEPGSGKPKVYATVFVLAIVLVGAAIFVVLHVRSKYLSLIPLTGAYKRLMSNGPPAAAQMPSNAYGEYSDPLVVEREEEEEEDEIVYMAQDGTVYHKNKYGMVADDEPEYDDDDESFSYQ